MLDFIYAVNTRYIALGHLTVFLKEGAPSGLVVLAYNNMLIAAIYKVDIAVILVEVSEQWQQIKVYGVPIRCYINSSHSLEIA